MSSSVWRRIREGSVLDFVIRVSAAFHAPADRELRDGLQHMALTNGTSFDWRRAHITADMALDAWKRSFRQDFVSEDPHAPFTSQQRREFCEAMRKLYDMSIPTHGRADLIRLGESIAARQGVDLEGLRAGHG